MLRFSRKSDMRSAGTSYLSRKRMYLILRSAFRMKCVVCRLDSLKFGLLFITKKN